MELDDDLAIDGIIVHEEQMLPTDGGQASLGNVERQRSGRVDRRAAIVREHHGHAQRGTVAMGTIADGDLESVLSRRGIIVDVVERIAQQLLMGELLAAHEVQVTALDEVTVVGRLEDGVDEVVKGRVEVGDLRQVGSDVDQFALLHGKLGAPVVEGWRGVVDRDYVDDEGEGSDLIASWYAVGYCG